MRRVLQIALASAVVLLAAAAGLWVWVGPRLVASRLKPVLEDAASSLLRRPLTIDALRWEPGPRQVLVATGVRLYEDPERRRLLAEASEVDAHLSRLSALQFSAGVSELDLIRPRLYLRREADGVWNAARVAAEIAARPIGAGRVWGAVSFSGVVVEDGTASLADGTGAPGSPPSVGFSGRGALRSGRFPFKAEGAFGSPPTAFTLAGEVGGPARFSSAPAAGLPPFTVDAAADRLDYGGTSLRRVRAVVRHGAGPIVLDSLEFRSLGGTFRASGSYLPSAPADGLKLSWTASGVDASGLFRLAGSSKAVEGVVDSEGTLAASPGPGWLSSLNGQARVDAKGVRLGDAPGLLKVVSKLNVATLLTAVSGRRRPVLAFDRARGAFKFAGGKVVTERPFWLENRTLQIGLMGAWDPAAGVVDGKVVVHVLAVTDEIIRMIPVANAILLGKEKSLIPIWLSAKGKASDPQVDILPAKTISAPLWNAVKRTLKLPGKVFDQLVR